MEWATSLVSEGTGRCHASQAFHVTENTCLCIQTVSPSACNGSPHQTSFQALFLAIMSYSAQLLLPSDHALWFPIFIRTGSFVLKTCFCFCCFTFVLGIFWLVNCVFPVDHAPSHCQFGLCLTAWFSWGAGPKQKWEVTSCVFWKFARNIHWKSDTKILNMHIELEENVLVA